NGCDYYLGRHGSKASEAEYDRIITEWLSTGRSSSFGLPVETTTIVELIADYVKYAAAYYGKNPRGEYPQVIRAMRPVKELYGRAPAEEFGVVQLKAVRTHISTPGRSRAYVNEIMRRVVALFKWAAAEGKLPASVHDNLAIVPGLRKGKCELYDPAPILPV